MKWRCHFTCIEFTCAPLCFLLLQLKIKKKKLASDQEQLVSKLDKALSLSRHKLKSPFKFADGAAGKHKTGGCVGPRYLSPHEALLSKDEKKNLAKSLSFSLKASKEGKNKMAAKMKKMKVGLKVKHHLKVSSSPTISDASSCSYSKSFLQCASELAFGNRFSLFCLAVAVMEFFLPTGGEERAPSCFGGLALSHLEIDHGRRVSAPLWTLLGLMIPARTSLSTWNLFPRITKPWRTSGCSLNCVPVASGCVLRGRGHA